MANFIHLAVRSGFFWACSLYIISIAAFYIHSFGLMVNIISLYQYLFHCWLSATVLGMQYNKCYHSPPAKAIRKYCQTDDFFLYHMVVEVYRRSLIHLYHILQEWVAVRSKVSDWSHLVLPRIYYQCFIRFNFIISKSEQREEIFQKHNPSDDVITIGLSAVTRE